MVTRKNAPVSKSHGSAVAEAPAKRAAAKAPHVALVSGTETVLEWWQLHGFADRNIRAESFGDPIGDLSEMTRSLGMTGPKGQQRAETDDDRKSATDELVGKLLPGWNRDDRHSITVTAATTTEQSKAVKERAELLAEWRGRGKEAPIFIALAEFAERYWAENGPPVAIVHNCHRRTYSLPAAAFARKERGIDDSGSYPVPVTVSEPVSVLAEIDLRLSENLGHDLGRSPMTPLDFLRTAKMIKDAGGNEAMLRKYGKVGEAQTAFRYMRLHDLHPAIKLYERAMLPRPVGEKGKRLKVYPYKKGESYIPYSTSMKETLAALLQDKQFDDEGPVPSRKNKSRTDSEVERFAEYHTLGGRVKAGWSTADTEELQQPTKYCLAINAIGWCIGGAKKGKLQKFNAAYGKELDAALKKADFSIDDFKE